MLHLLEQTIPRKSQSVNETIRKLLKEIISEPAILETTLREIIGTKNKDAVYSVVPNLRNELVKHGYPVENEPLMKLCKCAPRKNAETHGEKLYQICELIHGYGGYSDEDIAEFAGVNIEDVESVRAEFKKYNVRPKHSKVRHESVMKYVLDRKRAIEIFREEHSLPIWFIARMAKVPPSMMFSIAYKFHWKVNTDFREFSRLVVEAESIEVEKNCVLRDEEYVVEVTSKGLSGIKLNQEEWDRYRDIYELKKRGLTWTENGPVKSQDRGSSVGRWGAEQLSVFSIPVSKISRGRFNQ